MSDYVVGSSNFVLIVILLLVSYVIATYAWQRWQQSDINKITLYVLIGAAVEAFSWAIYRSYWLSWRLYKLAVGDGPAKVFYDMAWLTYVPTLGLYCGAALMMAPITIRHFDRYWVLSNIIIILLLQAIGILLVVVIKG